ncbi:MAG: transcription-repair coupling factor [Planctomycetes bacterium]|nr:transcription-repair coupling factor [Planctomycetota bacterium]
MKGRSKARAAGKKAVTAADLVARARRSTAFSTLLSRIGTTEDVVVGNCVGSAAAVLVAALAEQMDRPLLLAVPTLGEAQGLADDLTCFLPSNSVQFFPSREEAGFLNEAERSGFGRRIEIAEALARGEDALVVVAPVTALMEAVPDPKRVEAGRLTLGLAQARDRDELVALLADKGFERVSLVERPGQFAVRGGIVDVFDHVDGNPLRIELFGDVIDSLRHFDPTSQRSLGETSTATLSLMIPHEGDPGLREEGPCLLDLLSERTFVVLRDREDALATAQRRLERQRLSGDDDHEDRLKRLVKRSGLELCRLPMGGDALDLDLGGVEARGSDLAGAIETLEAISDGGREVFLFFSNQAERERFWAALAEDLDALRFEDLKRRNIHGFDGGLYRGFNWRSEKLCVVGHRELFDIALPRHRAAVVSRTETRAIDDFVDLEEGDYVVHVAQGIGRYRGIETIEKGGETQEFLVLEFADEVVLYVPVAKSDLIQKYIGGRGDAPRLSKLGGRSWSKKKEDAYRSVTDLAAEMLETQAVRARQEGNPCPPDSPWQHQFEAAFPYTETPDQLTAVEAIRADMESPRSMDRLLCGDVGYGKTEVAMRAAFKTVMAGKQVAVLVPTTVLAEQHLMSFTERMSDYPVTIAGLSRFRSKAEQESALVGLIEGSVDIVIGTHRLFSKDVAFKNLGLLVVDEEQRFGVAHKEKLRNLRRTVDVLTLSATPIPRTLHLSLLGIRDISSLTQPPRGRQPVETRIVPFDRDLVRSAVLRELERKGQCYFVHNRVQSIERVQKELAEIVPEARVLILHGQMKESQIEKNLMLFLKRKADVMLATTIIESGLDIPSANTIFIDRPDMYGLADLHQLRGRVGREQKKAFAFLLLRPDTVLGEDAEKRLRAIEEFNELGSGFRIAMRDLEIRGAGNLLGHQQHGHIAAIGYDLYCRLLDAAVKSLQKKRVVLPDEVDLNLDFEAFLPEDWIPDTKVKLEVYRKLGRARVDAEFDDLEAELRDRFGPLPRAAMDLVEVCRIRALAERVGLRRVSTSAGMGLIVRPDRMKSVRRRLLATETEHRIVDQKDLLLPSPEALATATTARVFLQKALLPRRQDREEGGDEDCEP